MVFNKMDLNKAVVDLLTYDNFRYRDIDRYRGIARLNATYNFKKKHKITNERFVAYNEIELTFATEQAKTWFLLNLN